MSGLELMTMVFEFGGAKTKENLMQLSNKEVDNIHSIYMNKNNKLTKEEKIDRTIEIVLRTLNIGYVFTENKVKQS